MRIPFRGYSSVGRAFEWHSKGQGFDSPYLHHKKEEGNETSGCSSFFVLKGLILQCLSGFEGVECGRIGRI